MRKGIRVKGTVKQGHGVASGRSTDPRFPKGTIEMQKPAFYERGLNLHEYFSGTINLSISPHHYAIKQPKYTFRNVKWSSDTPAEHFSFFDCRILLYSGEILNGLIYYPHPETKPEHFQAPDILEIITTPIDHLQYGDELIIEVDSQQMSIS